MNRLKELRQKRGLTQKEISEGTGIPVNTYSNYERGDREPKLEVWGKLAKYFGVDVPFLQGVTEEPNFTKEALRNALDKLDSSDDVSEQESLWDEVGELFDKEESQNDLFRGLSLYNSVQPREFYRISWRGELTPERIEILTSLGKSAHYIADSMTNKDFAKSFELLTEKIFNDNHPLNDEYVSQLLSEVAFKIEAHGEKIRADKKANAEKPLPPKKKFNSLYAKLYD